MHEACSQQSACCSIHYIKLLLSIRFLRDFQAVVAVLSTAPTRTRGRVGVERAGDGLITLQDLMAQVGAPLIGMPYHTPSHRRHDLKRRRPPFEILCSLSLFTKIRRFRIMWCITCRTAPSLTAWARVWRRGGWCPRETCPSPAPLPTCWRSTGARRPFNVHVGEWQHCTGFGPAAHHEPPDSC